MHLSHHEIPEHPSDEPSTAAPGGARYGVGPSKGRSNTVPAPGVAGVSGSEGAPRTKTGVVRAADEAALHRVARRRARQNVQRTARVDVRYSVDEKREITAEAQRIGLAGAHFVGAVVMAHLHGDHQLPGGRTPVDDLVDELAALRMQVARIGTNVNQIAHRLNAGGDPRPGDRDLLAEAGRILVLARQAATAIDTTADMAASTGRSD